MRGFGSAFRAEVRDLARHPLTWIGAAATVAACWVMAIHEPIRENGYILFESALQVGARTAAFFLLASGAISVASDRTRGTVRWILPRPIARAGYVLGKTGAQALFAVVLLVLAAGTSWAASSGAGFGDVAAEIEGDEDDAVFNYVEEEVVEPEFQADTMRRRTLYAALLVLPALLSATGIGIFVSSLVASSAGAVILAIAVALPLFYLPEVAGLSADTARALPFRAATDFLGQIREFGRHYNTAAWPSYGIGALAGALAAVFGLPLAAAGLYSRLDLTD